MLVYCRVRNSWNHIYLWPRERVKHVLEYGRSYFLILIYILLNFFYHPMTVNKTCFGFENLIPFTNCRKCYRRAKVALNLISKAMLTYWCSHFVGAPSYLALWVTASFLWFQYCRYNCLDMRCHNNVVSLLDVWSWPCPFLKMVPNSPYGVLSHAILETWKESERKWEWTLSNTYHVFPDPTHSRTECLCVVT